jgi:hypothetical protein
MPASRIAERSVRLTLDEKSMVFAPTFSVRPMLFSNLRG